MDAGRKDYVSCWTEEVVSQKLQTDILLIMAIQLTHYLCLPFFHYLTPSGKGKWKEIATLIPTRSTVQVKTHAQMVMKRVEAGEDVFEKMQNIKAEQYTCHVSDSLQENKTGQNTNCVSAKYSSFPIPLTITQRSKNIHQLVMNCLQKYHSLPQMDQDAVMILYQMAKEM